MFRDLWGNDCQSPRTRDAPVDDTEALRPRIQGHGHKRRSMNLKIRSITRRLYGGLLVHVDNHRDLAF